MGRSVAAPPGRSTMPEQPQWSERTLDMPPQDPWADAPTAPERSVGGYPAPGFTGPQTRPDGMTAPQADPDGLTAPQTRPGGPAGPQTRPDETPGRQTRPGGRAGPQTRPDGTPGPQ